MLTSMTTFDNGNYVPKWWHTSLVMIAVMILPILCNLWLRKVLAPFQVTGGVLHVGLFVVFIAVLIATGTRSDSNFVFKTLTTDASGWTNPGVS